MSCPEEETNTFISVICKWVTGNTSLPELCAVCSNLNLLLLENYKNISLKDYEYGKGTIVYSVYD